MEIMILDEQFRSVGVVDSFKELLWTDRYSAYGDFEIYSAVDANLLSLTQQDHYAWSRESEHTMIIEERVITSDVESGNYLQISGRSLESIIERRIVWNQTVLSGNFQDGIEKLLNENIISPSLPSRTIPNFVFQRSTDPFINDLTVDAQFTGDNLYDAIKKLCDANSIGFKVVLDEANQFIFSLYAGVDRSYAQNNRPFVIFNPKFENIINSNYLETKKTLKTVALVAGEGEGSARKTAMVGDGDGMERRELFVDARDISSSVADGTLTDSQYEAQLIQRGTERLANNTFIKTFEGEVEATQMFMLGRDFFLGDIVQIVNEYGVEARSRVGEIIHSQNESSGNAVVPTFTVVQEGGN